MRRLMLLGLVLVLIALWWLRPGQQIAPPAQPQGTGLAETLAGDTAGWARATELREFSFPADHGPHPDYKTEWWYFTGNLHSEGGRQFGYQLTLFRVGLKPGRADDAASAWRANHIYMGHLALTDVQGERFHSFERFARADQRLAGARAQPFAVWLEDWRVAAEGDGFLPLSLQAGQGEVAVDLRLDSAKPPVLQGEQGLSQKSAAPGNASYYYSFTRLPTRGEIRIGERSFRVSGNSWLDREWSTSALAPDQAGWDWFALQLADGRELMYYRLRKQDGSADPHSAGVLVGRQGEVQRLGQGEVQLQVLEHWTSPETRIRYPLRWRLTIPGQDLRLEVTPRLAQQEMDLSVRYWEGAVAVTGQAGGAPISGSGYLELAGYD